MFIFICLCVSQKCHSFLKKSLIHKYQGLDINMELPAGFEPTVSELQSLALPLGYGSSDGIITL